MNIQFEGYLELDLQVSFDTDEDGPQITSVVFAGADIMNLLTDRQMEELRDQAMSAEQIVAEKKQAAIEDRGDWLYEQAKDRKYEESQRAAQWCTERNLA